MIENPDIHIISDNAVIVAYPEVIDEKVNALVMDLYLCLGHEKETNQVFRGVLEMVPTYHTLQIIFDPLVCNPYDLVNEVQSLIKGQKEISKHNGRVIRIPVCYELPYGPDLDLVCQHHGLSRAEVIRRHTARKYLIFMMGFTPGFPYLGGMDESISMNRKEKPRLKIPAGSVGIAGAQTGVYPVESPGGWQIIGRTPYRLFDPQAVKPFLFEAGDQIEFYSISVETYKRLKHKST
ncbi:5-oxoprolinase subunit PxpB [Fusibacter sp. JL216-2]|uniref:5-oxoprolinase subunit PxpB n=1 Tax=Fusibacter sp. JL216-2 TaxID=3071453 RepID=UPI003D34D7EA